MHLSRIWNALQRDIRRVSKNMLASIKYTFVVSDRNFELLKKSEMK